MRYGSNLYQLICGTAAFSGFMLGHYVAQREYWVRKARDESGTIRKLSVKYARETNRDVLRTIRELRRRRAEVGR